MKFLQKLGKALMLPVAVLPICGILMGIGYWLCPATMQGGDIHGAANLIGLFLVKAGGALIDNMAILFAIGSVLAAEAINTAIEKLADFVSPAHQVLIGKAKDLAAAAVLILSICAFIIGGIIFIPKIIHF